MHSTVCCAILGLPIMGLNAVYGIQPFDSKNPNARDFVTGTSVVRPELTHLTPFQLSARDDRIKDCLRSGNCKN